MGESDLTTHGIRIEVESRYVPGKSQPAKHLYFFAYRIRITNVGDTTARLLARHWEITDGTGQVEHVRGPGVVGDTPRLTPGQSYEYESFCPLTTPLGAMRGEYHMAREDGSPFEVRIGEFSLSVPNSLN